jgi:hypothetical protein
MRCPPVDFEHSALSGRRLDPVTELKRLLEEQQQTGDDLADRVL